eukprot:TRINITY_DN4510_c0_g1_i3.p1 TRINITY_DN4510_c0_g1~~TRINITY_DN4510_c0_g1_i3.p1  ORF type:complete len:720 (-),score=209.85 TRINITY_DN4510_c0_g1_i3:77-2236(-)
MMWRTLQMDFFGALVLSTIASGKIIGIDASEALAYPGVVDFIHAQHVQSVGGTNEVFLDMGRHEVFASDQVNWIGQPIGVIVATSYKIAQEASALVHVDYSEADAIVSIEDAIMKGSYQPSSPAGGMQTVTRGDVDAGIKESQFVVSGSTLTASQQHFYMETQVTVAKPTEDGGLHVYCASQYPTGTRAAVMNALNLPARKVIVENIRCGGGFGGKIIRCNMIATAVAVCAKSLGRPVRLQTSRNQEMIMAGNRSPFASNYQVGFDGNGLIHALHIRFYADPGWAAKISLGSLETPQMALDNVYYIANYKSEGFVCRTNLPPNTAMRAPGTVNATYIIESVIERVASSLGVSADVVRARNYYKQGQVTPYGQPLPYFTLDKVLANLYQQSGYQVKLREVASFNQQNKWRKRGLHIVPHKYGIGWTGYDAVVSVNIIADDGTVFINQSGTEVGQGIYTKVAQAVAYSLGVDLSTISVGSVSTEKLPNFGITGGSGTSETCVRAALIACAELKAGLEPYVSAGSSWVDSLQAANNAGVNLSATGIYEPNNSQYAFDYFVYAAALAEVEIDVLTGEIQVLEVDISYDCGQSLNPAVDIGQIEGGFIQGLGFALTEERVLAPDGKNLSAGTWEYKPPSALDIPIKFNVSLLNNLPNPVGILKSKASGEPPYSLGFAVYFAAKNAIHAARKQFGQTDVFDLGCPASVDRIQRACNFSVFDMLLK